VEPVYIVRPLESYLHVNFALYVYRDTSYQDERKGRGKRRRSAQ
jgi:hypothetical protein